MRNDSSGPSFHAVEHVGRLGRRQPQAAAQHVPALGDELHVAVLDAVVHHLDEVPGAVRTDVRHARTGLGLRGDGLEHVAAAAPTPRSDPPGISDGP